MSYINIKTLPLSTSLLVATLAFCLTAMTGCGQKGALYLPQHESRQQTEEHQPIIPASQTNATKKPQQKHKPNQ